jgi:hypothetical protein
MAGKTFNSFSRSFLNDWPVLRTAPGPRSQSGSAHQSRTIVADPAAEQKQAIQKARGPHQKVQP